MLAQWVSGADSGSPAPAKPLASWPLTVPSCVE